MRIGILTKTSRSYTAGRFRDAARERGHRVRLLDPGKFALMVESGRPSLTFKGRPLTKLDAIIPRIGARQAEISTSVVRQFEQQGVYCANPSHAISIAGDKLRTLQVLSRHRIGIPASAFVFDKADIGPAIDKVGTPVIIKVLSGTQGAGVLLAETRKMAEAIIESLQIAKQNLLIQEFVSESRGRDIRAFVVGDRVVAAMRRIAQEDEFRSNVHLGAFTEAVELDKEYERAALLAAGILGLRIAGVDLLESNDGPKVMEVNASPGLEGIEAASGVNVAGEIIEFIEKQVTFPDLDIREHLHLSKGYRVVEIPILPKSPLAGQALHETPFKEQEILVLNIKRDSIVLPSPSGTEKILPGDVLLCYGKELVLKGYIPQRMKKKRKSAKDSVPENPTQDSSAGAQ